MKTKLLEVTVTKKEFAAFTVEVPESISNSDFRDGCYNGMDLENQMRDTLDDVYTEREWDFDVSPDKSKNPTVLIPISDDCFLDALIESELIPKDS